MWMAHAPKMRATGMTPTRDLATTPFPAHPEGAGQGTPQPFSIGLAAPEGASHERHPLFVASVIWCRTSSWFHRAATADGGADVLLREKRAVAQQVALNLGSTRAGAAGRRCCLLLQAGQPGMPGSLYLPAGQLAVALWLLLALDRLSAMMLVLCQRGTGSSRLRQRTLAPARCIFTLFQLQLMGLAGAFSHGRSVQPVRVFRDHVGHFVRPAAAESGRPRVSAACTTSPSTRGVFAVPDWRVHAVYGITGTLSTWQTLPAASLVRGQHRPRGCCTRLCAILGVAFHQGSPVAAQLLAGARPGAATAPVGAPFALMTKVGVGVILRPALCCSASTLRPLSPVRQCPLVRRAW